MSLQTRIFVVIFLVVQVAMPFVYYLNPDRDERFAWRMFVNPHHKFCEPTVQATSFGQAHTVELRAILHPGWIANIKENRPEIIEPYLDRLCREPGVESATLINDCRPDGPQGPVQTTVYQRDCPPR
ncbi:MAG: hypothetical protein R3E66_20535 [bacterium]